MLSKRLFQITTAPSCLVAFSVLSASAFTRVANTSLNVPLNPPTSGFTVQEAFGSLNFTRPVAIVAPPGETNRLFIVEKQGLVSVITNLAAPNRTVFLNIDARVNGGTSDNSEEGLLGLAFHPQYASNGFFYLFYTGTDTTSSGSGRHDILSRFQVMAENANQGDGNSEAKLIRQYDHASNHNGGDLHFGPDGYLYVSLGDEGNGDDFFMNSQRIDGDFFSGILRIDVDKRLGSLPPNSHPASTTNYAVPPDNPFVGATNFNGLTVNSNNIRTEFWAVGLRNPWRMSFDPSTGDLLCGDVGQGTREEVDLIVKGGNYGWAFREGKIQRPGSGTPPAGFNAIEPLLDYTRGTATNQGTVIIGGITYRGSGIQQLYGAYIFADAASGHIWALRHDGTNAVSWQWLASQFGISAFGVDPRNGDILMAAQGNNRIRRLVPAGSSGDTPPATLAETGVFSDLTTMTPHAGVVPYEVNLSFWSDNAIKSRWFSVPDTNQLMGFSTDGNWLFPTGSVWIKHFELELTNGVSESRRRLETRLLVKNSQGVHGFTYRWGLSNSNAFLVAAEGLDEPFVVDDGGGTVRTQVWHYPSRTECLACHTAAGGYALGFSTAQLNHTYDMGDGPENQLRTLQSAGYFSGTISNFHLMPSMPELTDTNISLEHRVRAYFAANCVSCHGPGGGAPAHWDARFSTLTANAGIIDGPLVNSGGNSSNHFITRGSPSLSEALKRISIRGPGQMPPLDSTVVDTKAVALLNEWITNDLPGYQFFPEWQVAQFGATNAAGAGAEEDFDGDGDSAYLEFLNDTNPKLPASRWRILSALKDSDFYVQFQRAANRGYELQYTESFTDTAVWTALDSPSNSPTFLSEDVTWEIPDESTSDSSRLYRVRAYER